MVTVSSKDAHAIECYDAVKANEGTTISAGFDNKDADVFCSEAVVNCGAQIDALDGVHNTETSR